MNKRNLSLIALVLGLVVMGHATAAGASPSEPGSEPKPAITATSSFVQTSLGLLCLASCALIRHRRARPSVSAPAPKPRRDFSIAWPGRSPIGQFAPV